MISFFLIVRRLPVTADAATPDSRGPIHESNRVLSGIAVALAAMAIGPAWNLLASNRSSATAIPEWPIATRVNNWDGPVQPSNVWRPTFSGVDRQQQVDYSNGEARVRTYVGTYLSQAQGKEMVNSENSWAEAGVTATVVGHHPVQGRMDVAEVTIEEGAALSRIRYQYRVDDLRTAHGLYAQLWYAAISLIRQPVATVIAVRSDCVGDCQAAGAALDDFWRASGIDER
jgi:EpsI family protein